MVCRLIDFAVVVFKLLMFKVCVIIGISKIKFFNFSGTERVKQNQENLKTIQNHLSLSVNHFSSNVNNLLRFFCFLLKLKPYAPLGGSQNRPFFGQQCFKNGKSKHCLAKHFLKEYSISFPMVYRLIDFALVVLNLLMFKICIIIAISKIEFFNFSGTKRVNGRVVL